MLAAISGGPDSTAMLHALVLLAPRLSLRVEGIHIHHGIRGEAAERDAVFAQSLARSLSVPFHLERVDAPSAARERGISLETAARTLRLEALERVAAREGCQRVALGHTADDQAETVIMWVIRGASLLGLAGIPPVRGVFVRPLLDVWRQDVVEYCRLAGLDPVTDETNWSREPLRNRIRHDLLPFVEQRIRPGARRALVRLAAAAREDEAYLRHEAARAWRRLRTGSPDEDGAALHLDAAAILALPRPIARRVLVHAFEEVSGGHRGELAWRHVEALVRMLERRRGGAVVQLPCRVRAHLSRGTLVLRGPHGLEAPPRML